MSKLSFSLYLHLFFINLFPSIQIEINGIQCYPKWTEVLGEFSQRTHKLNSNEWSETQENLIKFWITELLNCIQFSEIAYIWIVHKHSTNKYNQLIVTVLTFLCYFFLSLAQSAVLFSKLNIQQMEQGVVKIYRHK